LPRRSEDVRKLLPTLGCNLEEEIRHETPLDYRCIVAARMFLMRSGAFNLDNWFRIKDAIGSDDVDEQITQVRIIHLIHGIIVAIILFILPMSVFASLVRYQQCTDFVVVLWP